MRLFLIILCYSSFVYVCLCCVRFSFFSAMPRDWLGRTSPKWLILCRVGRKNLTRSESGSVRIIVIIMLLRWWSLRLYGGRFWRSSSANHLPGSSEPDAADRRHRHSTVPRQWATFSQHHLAQGSIARQHAWCTSERPGVRNSWDNRYDTSVSFCDDVHDVTRVWFRAGVAAGFYRDWKHRDPGCKFPPKVQPGSSFGALIFYRRIRLRWLRSV